MNRVVAPALDLPTIVAHGLCAGCGLCESIAGADSVAMALTSGGHVRPRVRTAPDAATMDRIRAVCPGITLRGPDAEQAGPHGTMHPIYGPIRSLHLGWAADPGLRFGAAAGGGMTALGCYLLQSGEVDAVLHVRASLAEPLLAEAVVSRTAAEVRSGAQSRYGPVAPLTHVMRLLDEGVRFAVLAKPCDVGAIRSLGRVDSRVAAQIPYLVTIFCGGVQNNGVARAIVGYHGLTEDEVAVFRWRGEGWPGATHVAAKDGRTFDLPYDVVWYSKGLPWKDDIQFRCKICPDAIGELADVACPDGWVMENGKPIHREAPGVNVFVARTAAGERLVAAAAAAGAIELRPFTVPELEAMHADHRPRKLEGPARRRALALEGEPAPNFENFRDATMRAMAGPELDAAAEAGTRRRLRAGRNREPLR